MNSKYFYKIENTANELNNQKYGDVFNICNNIFQENNAYIHKDLIFHNNPKKLAELTVDRLMGSLPYHSFYQKYEGMEVYEIFYSSFKIYTVFYQNNAKMYAADIILRKLYNPAAVDEWPSLAEELTPFNIDHTIEPMPKLIHNQFHFNEEVYVGDMAFQFHKKYNNIHYIPEVISNNMLESVKNLDYKIINLPIYTDIYLKAAVVYDHGDIAAIVYNSAEYELIPYHQTKDGYKVGSIFVVLRFILIRHLLYHQLGLKHTMEQFNKLLHSNLIKFTKKYYGTRVDMLKLHKKDRYRPYIYSKKKD